MAINKVKLGHDHFLKNGTVERFEEEGTQMEGGKKSLKVSRHSDDTLPRFVAIGRAD